MSRTSVYDMHEREARFIEYYCAADSPYYGDWIKSGIAAGYSEKGTRQAVQRVMERYRGKTFAESLRLLGMTKPYLAVRTKALFEDPKTKPAEKIQLLKLLLNNFGEKTEDMKALTINTPKALVVVGASQKRLDAMVAPQLEAEVVRQDLQP